MHRVKKINRIDGYLIVVTFEDRKVKIIDVEPYLDKGIFLALRDKQYFNLAKVEHGTLVWPNEADFCADVLYEIGKELIPRKRSVARVIKKTNSKRITHA